MVKKKANCKIFMYKKEKVQIIFHVTNVSDNVIEWSFWTNNEPQKAIPEWKERKEKLLKTRMEQTINKRKHDDKIIK